MPGNLIAIMEVPGNHSKVREMSGKILPWKIVANSTFNVTPVFNRMLCHLH